MGERFCSLNQLYKELSGNDVFLSPKLNEDTANKSHFSPKPGEDQKKRSLPQFATIFGKKFVGSFSPGWLFFLWSSSSNLDGRTPKSRWGEAHSRWGDASPRVPPTI